MLIRQSHRLGNETTRKDIKKNIGKNGTFVPFSKVERKKEREAFEDVRSGRWSVCKVVVLHQIQIGDDLMR